MSMSMSMLRGFTLLCLWLSLRGNEMSASAADSQPEASSVAATDSIGSSDENSCWVFTHLQKCGGETVKGILELRWGVRFRIYDTILWQSGEETARRFQEKGGNLWKVAAGGYTEALRKVSTADTAAAEAGAGAGAACKFFTLIRHPISRMVSAYFYCHVYEGDPACGSEIVRAREVDLLTFARHWSNFGLRQFALNFVSADDVMAYMRTPEAMALLPEGIEKLGRMPSWYLVKLYLERPQAHVSEPSVETVTATSADQRGAEQEGQLPDAQMYGMLEPVQDLFRNDFVAVGVLEEWNTTLALFDKALEMPDINWHEKFKAQGAMNVFKRMEKEKAETLQKAWTDPELKKYMWLDLLLYEHAVDVFHEQVSHYGLS